MSGNDQDKDQERGINNNSKVSWAIDFVMAGRARNQREGGGRPPYRGGYNNLQNEQRRQDARDYEEGNRRRRADHERENHHQEQYRHHEPLERVNLNGANRGFRHSGGPQRRENDRQGHGQRPFQGPPQNYDHPNRGEARVALHNNNYYNGNHRGSPRDFKPFKPSSFGPKPLRTEPYDIRGRGGFRGRGRGRGKDAQGSCAIRRGGHNYRPEGPHDQRAMLHQQESDDIDSYDYDGYDYIDDLIQFARYRLDQQDHLPLHLRLTIPQRDSTRPSSRRRSESSSRSDSKSRSTASSRSNSKVRSRCSSNVRSNGSRSPAPSSKVTSGWDIKRPGMEEDSESGIASNDHSDYETQNITANEVSHSDAVKTCLQNSESPVVDAFAAEPIDSTDVTTSTIDVSLLSSTVIEPVDSRANEKESSIDFSLNSPEDSFVVLSEVTESENGSSNDILPASPDNEETDLSETAATGIEPSNDFSPASPDNQEDDLSATAATENGPSNDFSSASPANQEADLSATAATEIERSNDFSPASPDNQNADLSVTAATEIGPNNEFSPASSDSNELIDISASTKPEIDVEPIDLSVKPVLNVMESEASNVESLSIITHSSDLSSSCTSFENSIDQSNSSFEKNDVPIVAVPSVLQERSNSNNDLSTPTRHASVPEKANPKLNRKRSIHANVSDDENSSAAANRSQQSDPEEVPSKKSKHHKADQECASRENKISEKSAKNTKPKEQKSSDAIAKSPSKLIVKLNKHLPNETRARKEKDSVDLFKSKAVRLNPKKSVSNENIDKKKRKIDLHNGKIETNKKPKISVKVDDVNDSKNIFKKNRIEQFKVILKIMQSRTEGWTLSQLDNLDSDNFCDAIHHYEKPSNGICSLVEVKIFDSSSKANKINYKNLFGDEFNIQKYFATFCEFESTGFSNKHSKLLIFTNRDVDEALFERNGITVTNLHNHYSFKVSKPYEQSKIYRKCLEYFELPKLAELLHELFSSSDKQAHFNMELMKKYHLALVNERVLLLNDEKQKGRSIRVAKFHANFIDKEELSDAAQELRKHLVNCHGKLKNDMKFRVGNKDFGKDTSSTKFEETVDKLPDENSEKSFEHFFKVFQIIKIDERKFVETIVNVLGEEFLKLDEKIYSDAVQQELLTYLKDNGLNPNLLEPLKHTISKLKVTETILNHTNPQPNVEFGEETFSSLLREIGTEDIILCSTESLMLSDLKMRQFSKNKSYLENVQSLFITDEILFSMTDDVVKAFTHRQTNLLVILWKNNVMTNHAKKIDDAMKRLRNVITETSNTEKFVVIIASKENINLSLPQYQFIRIDDDLTLESQSEFFNSTSVFLQKRTLKLTDLADVTAIDSLIKSPKFLEKLIAEQMKIGRELAKPLGFTEKLFDFKLKQRIVINPKIFQEKIDDVFVIRNITCETFFRDYKPCDRFVSVSNSQPNSYDLPSNARFILLDNQVNPESIVNNIKGSKIHLLSYESHKFIWKSTIGSLANLLKFKTNENEACNTPNTIEEILLNGPKTMLISGEPGMGKSVCLYDIAKISSKLCHIQYETSDPIWHVQVNLDQPLQNTLKGYPIKTPENAIHFLADYLELRDEQKDLFIMSAQGRLKLKLMLFVDGYDDANENVDLMTSLLQHLQDSYVQRIFVASKTEKLEKVLNTFSYSIQFGNEEKAQFVEKFGANIDLTTKEKLLNTPLHLNMLMELIQKKPEKISIDNHYNLYKSYVNLHLPSDQLKNAYNLSAQKLLNEKELEETGAMLEDVDLDLPEQLSHKTITEYFVAKWLSKHRRGIKQCVNNLIDRTSSIFLSSYLTSRREKEKNVSIDGYAEHGHLNFLKAFLAIDDSNKPCLKRLIRKGKNNTLEVLRFLLEHYNDTGCYDYVQSGKYVNSNLAKYVDERVDGQTPLEIAAECEKIDLACELMLKGADVSVLDSRSSFVTNAATYATKEFVDGNERLGPVAAILLEKSPQVTADLDNETQLPKLLAYLFSRGYAKLVEELLNVRNISERNDLLQKPVNGKSLLAHVNDSRFLTDDARQSLILYLVKNTHGNLLRDNIDSILHHACLSGHEHTFNYFMHFPKTSIVILHQALRSNDLRVIEFLMRDSKRTIDSDGNTALHQAIILKISRKTINFLLGKVGINDKNNSGETALHLAFKEGANLSLIKFLVKAGASLSITNDQGFCPWVFALKEESSRYCKSQQRELLNFLYPTNCLTFPNCRSKNLDFDMTKKEVEPKLHYFADPSGFDLNLNCNGDSRLHSALPNKDEKYWCIFLINHGAEVNIEKDGKFAFHVALDNQRFDVAKLMLQHGAIIDQLDQYKNTPLNYLTSRPRDNEAQKMIDLLNKAIGIFARGTEGRRDFESMLKVNHDNIDYSDFRYLLNCRNKHGKTLLHVAACASQPNIIEHLHKLSIICENRYKDFKPMNVNAVNQHGNTPLHLAAQKVNVGCVEKLLAIGAKFGMKNYEDKQPMDLSPHGSPVRKLLKAAEDLFKQVEKANIEKVKGILKNYPVVQHARDDSGKTPLFYVENEEMIKYLIAGVNVVDENERPPMYYAAKENCLGRVKLLLKAGANYDFRGFRDESNKSFELLKRIDEIFEDVHSHEPKFFVEGNPWALVKELDDISKDFGVARDIIVNTKDNQKNTLLHYAAKYDYVEVAENLLKNGAIYNSRNKRGKTPEDLAISKGLFKCVNDLFVNLDVNSWENIDPNLAANCRMSGGYTLLHKAVEKGCYETVKWLVDRGADVKATGNNSVGVRVDKYPEIARLLEKKR